MLNRVEHIALAVADLDAALALFKGLLGGTSVAAGAGSGLGWVDMAWPGGGRLRLVGGDALAMQLDRRSGRVHHIAFRVDDPAGVSGAVARDAWWEVPSAPPLGTRLVLAAPDGSLPVLA